MICGCSEKEVSTTTKTVTSTVVSTERITDTKNETSYVTIENTVTKIVTSTVYTTITTSQVPEEDEDMVYAKIGNHTLKIKLEDNSSAAAFRELLSKGDVTIEMHDYGNFEKVGDLGTSLPRNDTSITTEPGDVILYQGNSITIYYAKNTWSFTRLGRVQDLSADELKQILGSGNVTVIFSLQ